MRVILLTGKTRLQALASVALLSFGGLSLAEDSESLATIQSTAEHFAIAQINRTGLSDIRAEATRMDARLTLAKCEFPLEAFTTSNVHSLTRTTIGVRCAGPKPWTLYVPVTISATTEAVFTRRPLSRGEALQSEHLEVRPVSLDKVPAQYFTGLDQLKDMELTQSVNGDTILSLRQIKTRQVVQRGQEVVILADSPTIKVRMSGIALKNGSSGELIPVRNSNSGRTIEAVVIDAESVSVRIW